MGGAVCWARLASCLARTWAGMVSRWRAVWLRGVHHDLVTRRGGVGGERGGEQRALHDPIVLTILVSRLQDGV
eukprot:scaffold28216_cov31-Tisochrysis_lutea.AAC.7